MYAQEWAQDFSLYFFVCILFLRLPHWMFLLSFLYPFSSSLKLLTHSHLSPPPLQSETVACASHFTLTWKCRQVNGTYWCYLICLVMSLLRTRLLPWWHTQCLYDCATGCRAPPGAGAEAAAEARQGRQPAPAPSRQA